MRVYSIPLPWQAVAHLRIINREASREIERANI